MERYVYWHFSRITIDNGTLKHRNEQNENFVSYGDTHSNDGQVLMRTSWRNEKARFSRTVRTRPSSMEAWRVRWSIHRIVGGISLPPARQATFDSRRRKNVVIEGCAQTEFHR